MYILRKSVKVALIVTKFIEKILEWYGQSKGKVAPIVTKFIEKILEWYGQAKGREYGAGVQMRRYYHVLWIGRQNLFQRYQILD